MKQLKAGSSVKGGYYFNLKKWEIVTASEDATILRGDPEDLFVRVPLPLLFILAPLMGGLFVIFLPLIGFVLAIYAVAQKVGLVGSAAVGEVVATVSPVWRPGEAHFAGKPDEKTDKPGAAATCDDGLDKLQKDIDERRRAEENKQKN